MTNDTHDAIRLGNFGDADTLVVAASQTIENPSNYQRTFRSAGSPSFDQIVDANSDDGEITTKNSLGWKIISHDLENGSVGTPMASAALRPAEETGPQHAENPQKAWPHTKQCLALAGRRLGLNGKDT